MTQLTNDLLRPVGRVTPGPRRRPRSPRLARTTLLVLVLALCLFAQTGCETTESARVELLELVNASRAAAGVPKLERDVQLEAKADEWARRLRDRCRLSHSRLADGAPAGWYKLGENVGRGSTLREVHTAFLGSPGHRANVLDPAFSAVGTAAVWGDCGGLRQVFVVTVYLQPR